MIRLRVVAVIALLLPRVAASQFATVALESLPRGAEIRVWARQPKLDGWRLQFLGRTDTSVVVAERPGSVRVVGLSGEIQMKDLDRLELKQGRRPAWDRLGPRMLKGAGIGAGVALTTALIVGATRGGASDSDIAVGPVGAAVLIGGPGALIGSIVGGASVILGTTRWTPIRIR